jgi:hypothetical protein
MMAGPPPHEYPPTMSTIQLTGAELIPILLGSVYQTFIPVSELIDFIVAGRITLPMVTQTMRASGGTMGALYA